MTGVQTCALPISDDPRAGSSKGLAHRRRQVVVLGKTSAEHQIELLGGTQLAKELHVANRLLQVVIFRGSRDEVIDYRTMSVQVSQAGGYYDRNAREGICCSQCRKKACAEHVVAEIVEANDDDGGRT